MTRLDIPDLRTKELLTIIALAEYGSFVAAASHLKTSQPALTRTVKRVERVLGVLLFARNTRRVEITPAGREFVAVAERMLNDLKITSRSLGEIAGEQRGRITVSTYSAFASQTMPPLAKCFLPRGRSSSCTSAKGCSSTSTRTFEAAWRISASASSTR